MNTYQAPQEKRDYTQTVLNATTLQDLWYQAIYKVLEIGEAFQIDRGSFAGDQRLEFDWFTAKVKRPNTPNEADRAFTGDDVLLPRLSEAAKQAGIPDPVEKPLAEYLPYLMTPAIAINEAYTYGQRLWLYPIPNVWHQVRQFAQYNEIFVIENEVWDNPDIVTPLTHPLHSERAHWMLENDIEDGDPAVAGFGSMYVADYMEKVREGHKPTHDEIMKLHEYVIFGDSTHALNQVAQLIWTYSNKGFRNNQMVFAIEHPLDMLLQDPPCLRKIETRVQNGKLIFVVSFRSWDLWGGLPANLAAILILQEFVANAIGVEVGEMCVECKGLHIYKYVWELAEFLRGKTIEEFRAEAKASKNDPVQNP